MNDEKMVKRGGMGNQMDTDRPMSGRPQKGWMDEV